MAAGTSPFVQSRLFLVSHFQQMGATSDTCSAMFRFGLTTVETKPHIGRHE